MCHIVFHALRERAETALVARESVDLGQRLHHETRVKVVDEVPHAINGVIPRAIRILRVENEIEISLSRFQVRTLCKQLRRARQQKCAICRRIDDTTTVERRIGAGGGIIRQFELLDVGEGVSRG